MTRPWQRSTNRFAAACGRCTKFFDWALKNGQKMASELDYVPMPEGVVKIIADAWKTQLKDSSGKPIL